MISLFPIFKDYFESVLETPLACDILDGSFSLIQLVLISVAAVHMKTDANAVWKE